MKYIQLKGGLRAIVDDDDFAELDRFVWTGARFRNTHYAIRCQNGRTVYMHRVVLGAARGVVVDHINRNGLDNRKANLRPCDSQGNATNSCRQPGGTGYHGVHRGSNGKFKVRVWVRDKSHGAGRMFDTAEEAAMVRDEIAKQHFGEFAKLNFPRGER